VLKNNALFMSRTQLSVDMIWN